jgi:D-alanyl-lipoteichoic acid acyltransferase DltB (MBOAT superfamily)
MNFLSLVFIAALPVILLLYRVLPSRIRPLLLLCASWAFYLYKNLDSFWILIFVTVISYVCGVLLSSEKWQKRPAAGNIVLITGSAAVLSFLVAYKYLGFGTVLPIGISFYTFQTMSYIIDVYRGTYRGEKNILTFSLFVSFFPQLVAGPIERPGDLIPQLKKSPLSSKSDMVSGLTLMITGYFKKVVVADYIAPSVDLIFASPATSKGFIVLLGAFLFAIQIYADFSGYSDIARGIGKLLGIDLHLNFDHPYRASNIREFWRRWHITLTSWFTDYIYIPLGGSRRGYLRKALNTLIVFGLSGLWHGAGLKFLIWGLGHAVLILIEDISPIRKVKEKLPAFLNIAINFTLVSLLWIFFRADSFSASLELLGGLFTGIADMSVFMIFTAKNYLLMALCALSIYFVPRYTESRKPGSFWVMYILVLIIIGSKIEQIRSGIQNSFIYFRF